MEELWLIGRQQLRELLRENPERNYRELAVELGFSLSWIKKWVPRLRVDLANDELLKRRSSPHRKSQPSRSSEVIKQILAIRDEPPDDLRRTPDPQAILYYLQKDETLRQRGVQIPRSTRTVWQVLNQYNRIARKQKIPHEPLPLAHPMQHWQFDFKEATTVQQADTEKQAHLVEILNVVDVGTSIVLDNVVREDFNAETTILSLASVFIQHGLPKTLTFDCDPRFVGAPQSRDFPSALLRFLWYIGVQPLVCPPRRPDKNAYVERFHRSLEAEALQRATCQY